MFITEQSAKVEGYVVSLAIRDQWTSVNFSFSTVKEDVFYGELSIARSAERLLFMLKNKGMS